MDGTVGNSGGQRTAPRVDIYTGFHKALRHFLSDTLSLVGRVDVSDEAELAAALAQACVLLPAGAGGNG